MKVSAVLLLSLGALCLAGLALAAPRRFDSEFLLGEKQKLIDEINSKQSTWKAGHSPRFEGQPLGASQRLLGSLEEPAWARPPVYTHTGFDIASLPESFDAREQWPECPSLRQIRDQSNCGSCWAFAVVHAANDRLCIGTNGQNKNLLSEQDMLACCSSCGFGCDGGYPSAAWSWLTKTGVVTGGSFQDTDFCYSYSMPKCVHRGPDTTYPSCKEFPSYPTPQCTRRCDANSTYPIPYEQDKTIFGTAYSISSDQTQIMQELMTNGPISVSFTVYSDFELYTGGIYQWTGGSRLGGHAVKLVGWGVENGIPYWTIVNSWNEGWGEKGTFRIIRGRNECGIEGSAVSGRINK